MLLSLLLFLWGGALLQAQEKGKTKVLLQRDRIQAQFDTVNCVKNVIKANPLVFFRGEIPLYYERALTPRLSLELGAGITLRNYIDLSFGGDQVDDIGAGTDILIRPSFHLATRYYLVDDIEPQGWYLQLGFSHLEFVRDINTKGPTGEFTGEKLRDERIFDDIRLWCGHQMLASSSNWLWDVYGGLAMRNRSMTVVSEMLDLTNDTYSYAVERKNDVVPAIFLGVRVGLGF